MTKCSVRSWRKRSAGSNRLAAFAAPAQSRALASSAAIVGRVTRGTREHDAEDERRKAKKTGANEEECVGVEQRTSGRELLDPQTGKPFRELADVGVCRAEQRVLRRSIAKTRQTRHVSHQRDTREADPEIVDRNHGTEH